MKIGMLSKRTHMLAADIKDKLESLGHEVEIFTADNLCINESLLNKDFYILKSKHLFFLYAGFYLVENGIPVIPDPYNTHKQKNRIDSKFLFKEAQVETSNYYIGTLEALKNQLEDSLFPLITKPMMGSGSRGVKVIHTKKDLDQLSKDDIIYLEQFIEGEHYLVYFLDEEICTMVKPPLSDEHAKMTMIETPNDIKELMLRWKRTFDLMFGHLDIIREEGTNKLYVVDPGAFPVFSNWKCKTEPVSKICDLILNRYKTLKHNF